MAPPCGTPMLLPTAVLWMNRLLVTVAGEALLPEMCSAPPTLMLSTEALVLLPLNVVPVMVNCSPAAPFQNWYSTAEPELLPLLWPLTVELVMVSEPPWNSRPPPYLLVVAELTSLLLIVELLTVKVSFVAEPPDPPMMPAPPKVVTAALVMVTPEMLVGTPPMTDGSRSNTRLALFPSMIVLPAPAPFRVMLLPDTLPICSSPLVRVYVPAATVMVEELAPALFAAQTASRRLPD